MTCIRLQKNTSRRPGWLAAAFLSTLLAAGCGDSSDDEDQAGVACEPTFASIQSTIFKPTCAVGGCHSGAEPAGDLDLFVASEAELLSQLVGVSSADCGDWVRVTAGDPGRSLIVHKLDRTQTDCGDPMPPASGLSTAQVQCISGWVAGLQIACDTCGGSECVALDADASHCGKCDNVCPSEADCIGRTCVCAGGERACGDQCVDTQTDPNHCGLCDKQCGADGLCNAGSCACAPGLSECNSGCVDLDSDVNNCGECEAQCAPGEACQSGDCVCATSANVSFATDIQPIFTASCAGSQCHSAMAHKSELILAAGRAYEQLVGVATDQCGGQRLRVAPGNPSGSYLMNKVTGYDMCGTKGARMPRGNNPVALTDTDYQNLSAWICSGAPEN